MVSFVNIQTGQFYDFESWDEVIAKGGIRSIFGGNYRDFLYNEGALNETAPIEKNWEELKRLQDLASKGMPLPDIMKAWVEFPLTERERGAIVAKELFDKRVT